MNNRKLPALAILLAAFGIFCLLPKAQAADSKKWGALMHGVVASTPKAKGKAVTVVTVNRDTEEEAVREAAAQCEKLLGTTCKPGGTYSAGCAYVSLGRRRDGTGVVSISGNGDEAQTNCESENGSPCEKWAEVCLNPQGEPAKKVVELDFHPITYYAAHAIGEKNNVVSLGTSKPNLSPKKATTEAIEMCSKKGKFKNCKLVHLYYFGCSYIAAGVSKSKNTFHWGISPTEEGAVKSCNEQAPNLQCDVKPIGNCIP